MTRVLLVAAAGAGGAVVRYRIGTSIGARSFPWATLGINIVGSFLLGLVLGGPGAARQPRCRMLRTGVRPGA